MTVVRILIIILVVYIVYQLYRKHMIESLDAIETIQKSDIDPVALLDKKPVKSALKNNTQYYEIDTLTADTIVNILNEKFIKYKYVKFNISNLPVSTRKLKGTEATVLMDAITRVFNNELKKASTRLHLVQIIPLYKMETDVESTYSLQVEYAVDPDISIAPENRVIRLQLNIVVHKRDIRSTFFDQVYLDGKDTKNKVDKIYITQIKRINTLDNLYDMGNQDVPQGEFGIDLMVRTQNVNKVNDLHANEMNHQYTIDE